MRKFLQMASQARVSPKLSNLNHLHQSHFLNQDPRRGDDCQHINTWSAVACLSASFIIATYIASFDTSYQWFHLLLTGITGYFSFRQGLRPSLVLSLSVIGLISLLVDIYEHEFQFLHYVNLTRMNSTNIFFPMIFGHLIGLFLRVIGQSRLLNHFPFLKKVFRTQIGEESRSNSERLQLALEAARMGTWDIDFYHNKFEESPLVASIFGLSVDQKHQNLDDWRNSIHPDDRDRVWNQYLAIFDGQSRFEAEYRIIWPDGITTKWVLSKGNVWRDKNGNPRRAVGISMDITERKLSEQKLKMAREQLQLITETVHANMALCDKNYQFRWTNQRYAQRFGLKPQQLIGRSLIEVFGKDVFHAIKPLIDRVLTGEMVESEVEIKYRGSAEKSWVHCLYNPIYHEKGQIEGWISVVSDISARKKLEAALKKSEERYRSLTEATSTIIWTTNPSGTVVERQPTWEVYTGQIWEEYQDMGWLYAIHPDDRKRIQLLWEETCRRGIIYYCSGRLWHKASNSYRHFEGRAVPILNEDQSIREWVGAFVDIQDQKQAELALSESEETFRQLIEQAPDAVFIANLEGVYTAVNSRAGELLGYAREQLIGRSICDLIHPMARTKLVEVQNDLIAGLENRGEWDLKRADGSFLRVEMSTKILSNRIWVAFVRDISERQRMEMDLRHQAEQLAESDRRKDEFLATLAHELRNPLAPIRNAVQILKLKNFSNEQITWATELIDRQGEHLTRLVDDLLDVSRITRGKIDLCIQKIELREVIQHAIETNQPLIESLDHQLEVNIPDSRCLIEADVTRMSQVISNLLNNAVKYTPRGGTILLTAILDNSQVRIKIKDNGIGIPEHMLPQIFNLFTQADTSLERSHGGLGVGLTIVKNLVELQGGRVTAFSEGIGQGSEFTVTMPVALTQETSSTPAPIVVDKVKKSIGKPLLLVVDDNKDSADSISLVLMHSGKYRTLTAYSGQEAISIAEKMRPKIILLDIGMPEMNGFEVSLNIRNLEEMKDVIIIAMTGWGQEKDRQMTKDAGFNFHLVKPVDFCELHRLLEAVK